MALPPKRQKVRSGIARAPQREWPRHRKFVRGHACCVPGCQDGPIEFAHVRTGTDGGTALKPSDTHGISLCVEHHREQHQIGEPAFERRYRIDMKALAAEFARKSPDIAMREAMVSYQDEEEAA